MTKITVRENEPFKVGDHVWIREHRSHGGCVGTIGVIKQLASLSDQEIIECTTCGRTDVIMDRSAAPKK